NIAYRSQRPGTPEPYPTTTLEHQDLFVDSGIDGRGHRTNMLSDQHKEIGVGIVAGEFEGYNALMTTEDFAYVSGNSFITGVAYTDTVTADSFYTPGEGLAGVTISAVRTSDGLSVTDSTFATGGYSLRVPAGTYTVTATGGGISTPIVTTVTVGSKN